MLILLFPSFTGPFSPQVFIHHLTAETNKKQKKKLLRLTCYNDPPDGKV